MDRSGFKITKAIFSATLFISGYGWGSLATFIICLGSIAGVIVIPCASKSVYRGIMAVFMGMAVGTLVADALLHLLPMVRIFTVSSTFNP